MRRLASLPERLRARLTRGRPVGRERSRDVRPEAFSNAASEALNLATEAEWAEMPAGLRTALSNRFDPMQMPCDQPAERTLFMHVPKTAGSSLVYTLRPAYDRLHALRFDRVEEDFKKAWEQAQRPGRHLILGHMRWDDIGLALETARFVTIIRNPADRLASLYNYNRSPAHPPHKEFRAEFSTFEAFLDSRPTNAQLDQLAGSEGSVADKITRVVENYHFVGVKEHLSRSLYTLGQREGLRPLFEHRVNITARINDPVRLTPVLRDEICKAHLGDWMLFSEIEPLYRKADIGLK